MAIPTDDMSIPNIGTNIYISTVWLNDKVKVVITFKDIYMIYDWCE